MPNFQNMSRGFGGASGGGTSQQATFAGSPADAYAQAIRALQQSQAEITWQQPPTSARFVLGKKDTWTTGGVTIKYDGELQVQPAGPGQTSARFTLRINWGSFLPLGLTMFIAGLLLSVTNYMFAVLGLPFILGLIALSAWQVSSGLPEKVLKDVIKNLQGGGPAPAQAPQQTYSPPPPPQPQAYTPPPPVAPPAPAPAPADNTASIVEQIKQLAGLRDAGAITADEFEAKKAELLKRI